MGSVFRASTLFLLTALAASVARADSIDDTVESLMKRKKVPGVSLAVIKDGRIVKARGYGVVLAGSETRVTTETLFQAGAVSKPVAALGVLHLVEQRRLSLDEDINRTLLNWEVPASDFTREKKVTLRGLLSHSAGLTVHGFPGYVSGGRTPTLVQVLDGRAPANTAPIRVAFTPGSKWQYSGGGYTVMQQWVLDVSGQPFPEYMRQAVLEPLGMNASTFEQPLPNSRAEQAATGHSEGQPVKGRWHVHPEMAAAGLWTTPSDIARFAIGVQAALAGRDHRVISQQLARDMVTRQIQEDGLGVFVSGSGPALRFDHGGRNVGFDTQMVAYAEAGLGAVIMLNANDNTGLASRVLDAVAVVYQWPDYPVRKALEPIEDKEPELTAKVRRIFDEIRQGRIERALFTRELAFTLVQQMASELRAEMIAYGALQSIALVGRSEERGLRVYRYQIVFAEETILVTCTVLSDGRISGLTFRAE